MSGQEHIGFSPAQVQRLGELSIRGGPEPHSFAEVAERDRTFEDLQRALTLDNLNRLDGLRESGAPLLGRLARNLADHLREEGFVEVTTPILIGKGSLQKMGLDPDHPLWRQVYWVDRSRCLRPMLAPNLYYLLGHLQRIWELPVRIFELGTCFRKETKGARHLSEFTMLNLVELGPEKEPEERLTELAHSVMGRAGIEFDLETTDSEVYGPSMDVVVDDVEIASGFAGHHRLDENWGITDAWVGWGFGLERMAMVLESSAQIHRFGRSLIYLDGARLNIQRQSSARQGAEA